MQSRAQQANEQHLVGNEQWKNSPTRCVSTVNILRNFNDQCRCIERHCRQGGATARVKRKSVKSAHPNIGLPVNRLIRHGPGQIGSDGECELHALSQLGQVRAEIKIKHEKQVMRKQYTVKKVPLGKTHLVSSSDTGLFSANASSADTGVWSARRRRQSKLNATNGQSPIKPVQSMRRNGTLSPVPARS